MFVVQIIVALLAIAGVIAIPFYRKAGAYSDARDLALALMVVGAIAVGSFFGIRWMVRTNQSANARACAHWGKAANRETKHFYVGGGSYKCMTKSTGDTWIPVGQVREVAP